MGRRAARRVAARIAHRARSARAWRRTARRARRREVRSRCCASCAPTRAAAGCSTRRTPMPSANGRSRGSRTAPSCTSRSTAPSSRDGVRWIVDFKTGATRARTSTRSSSSEVERYRGQLERYARIVRALDARPIRLALYYPLREGGWREWAVRGARNASEPTSKRLKRYNSSFWLTLPCCASTLASGLLHVRIYRGLPARADAPVALTIGNFDGVHRGHQAMLVAAHRSRGGPAPAARGADLRSASARILRARTPRRRGCRRCARSSRPFAPSASTRTYVARFDARACRADAARVHRRRAGARGLRSRWVLVGDDFRFGKGRAGDLAVLRAHAATFSVEGDAHGGRRERARVVDARCATALAAGDLERAAALLGRPYAITRPRGARREARPQPGLSDREPAAARNARR